MTYYCLTKLTPLKKLKTFNFKLTGLNRYVFLRRTSSSTSLLEMSLKQETLSFIRISCILAKSFEVGFSLFILILTFSLNLKNTTRKRRCSVNFIYLRRPYYHGHHDQQAQKYNVSSCPKLASNTKFFPCLHANHIIFSKFSQETYDRTVKDMFSRLLYFSAMEVF